MTSRLLDPIRAIVRRRTTKPVPRPHPFAWLDGLDVPPHLIGRPIDVVDGEGRIVATSRRQYDPKTMSMIG